MIRFLGLKRASRAFSSAVAAPATAAAPVMSARRLQRQRLAVTFLKKARTRYQAEQAYQKLSKIAVGGINDAKLLTLCMSCFKRVGFSRKSLKLFYDARDRGVELDAFLYSSAISACGEGAMWQRARDLLDEMKEKGIQPNLICYNSTISVYERAAEWQKALELLEEMRSTGLAEPNVISYSSAMSACAKSGQWQEALKLLETMKSDGGIIKPDLITYNTAISACEKGGRWELAFGLLGEMREEGVEPDKISYSAAISACEKCERWEEAFQLIDEVRQGKIEADKALYEAMISVCNKCERVEDATRFLEEMREKNILKPNDVKLRHIAIKKGQEWKRALERLDEDKARGVESLESYNEAISACEKGNRWGHSLELLDEMREREFELNETSYTAAISACGKGGLWERAIALLQEMRGIESITPSETQFTAVISACELAGETSRAMDIFRDALDLQLYQSIWNQQPFVLDLDKIPAPVARTAIKVTLADVKEFMNDADRGEGGIDRPFTIITGRGDRDEDGEFILRPAILAMFRDEAQYQMECIENPNYPEVLHITVASLENWALSRASSSSTDTPPPSSQDNIEEKT